MNQKLIKLSDTHYVVVDDSNINEGDWIFYPVTGAFLRWDGNTPSRKEDLKITHSTQKLESIYNAEAHEIEDGSFRKIKPLSLQEVEEAINGYSVEKMADEYAKNEYPSNMYTVEIGMPHRGTAFRGFIEGFKAAMELTKDKLFTIHDMKDVFNAGVKYGKEAGETKEECFKREIKSLLPKTEWDIELIDGKIKLI